MDEPKPRTGFAVCPSLRSASRPLSVFEEQFPRNCNGPDVIGDDAVLIGIKCISPHGDVVINTLVGVLVKETVLRIIQWNPNGPEVG